MDELRESLKNKEVQTVNFSETSKANNVFAQMFEITPNNMTKLDVIDFGTFPSGDVDKPDVHVFFVGKIYLDSFGRHTYVNLFTLVFE